MNLRKLSKNRVQVGQKPFETQWKTQGKLFAALKYPTGKQNENKFVKNIILK